MAKRTNWSPATILSVVTRALDLRVNSGLGVFEAMRSAQEELVEVDRRVAEGTLRNPCNWSWPLYEAAINAGLLDKSHVRWQRKYPTPVAVEQPVTNVNPVGVTIESATVPQLLEALGKRMQHELEQRMLGHINDVLMAGLAQTIGDGTPSNVAKPAEPTPAGRSCFRALAVGLLPVQQHILETKMQGQPVELRFWKDGPHDSLRALARWADRTFLATRFVGHETQNILRNSTTSITYVNGAVTDMATLIGLEASNVGK